MSNNRRPAPLHATSETTLTEVDPEKRQPNRSHSCYASFFHNSNQAMNLTWRKPVRNMGLPDLRMYRR